MARNLYLMTQSLVGDSAAAWMTTTNLAQGEQPVSERVRRAQEAASAAHRRARMTSDAAWALCDRLLREAARREPANLAQQQDEPRSLRGPEGG